MSEHDPLVDLMDELIKNGGEFPQKVTNRMIFAMAFRSARQSLKNEEKIDRNLETLKDEIKSTNGRVEDLEKSQVLNDDTRSKLFDHLKDYKSLSARSWAIIALLTVVLVILGAHGIDLPLPIP